VRCQSDFSTGEMYWKFETSYNAKKPARLIAIMILLLTGILPSLSIRDPIMEAISLSFRYGNEFTMGNLLFAASL
jgi:hypothetical protein